MAKQRTILGRVEVQVVTAVMEGDRVLGETAGPVLRCYSSEEMQEVWARAEQEVAAANAPAPRARARKGASS